MSLETDLVDYLAADTDVSDLMGARIYDADAPTDADLPYLTIQRISTTHEHHQEAAAGLAIATIQTDVWASSQAHRETGAEAVRGALDVLHHTTMGSTDVSLVSLEGPSYTYDPPPDASETGGFRARIDATIWYAETVPTFS